MPDARTTGPTELDWARASAAIGRLAARLDAAGREDVSRIVDVLEMVVNASRSEDAGG